MCDRDECKFHARVEWLGPNKDNVSRRSDKFYEICIVAAGSWGYNEIRRWGKWGTTGQTKLITHLYLSNAKDSALKQLKAKRKKGYREPVDALTRLAHQVNDE